MARSTDGRARTAGVRAVLPLRDNAFEIVRARNAEEIDAAIAPAAALQSTFDESLAGPLAGLIVRNWGILIALVGVMLILAAFNPANRRVTLLVAGASNPKIAAQLYLSETTVKRKLQDIFEKLGVSNRAQVAAEAVRRGLI